MNHRHEPSYRFAIGHGKDEALGIRVGHGTCACGEDIVQYGSHLRAWRVAADVQLGAIEGPAPFDPSDDQRDAVEIADELGLPVEAVVPSWSERLDRVADQPLQGPAVFAPIVPTERRFEVTLRNGISPRGMISRPFGDVATARAFATTERPWNNTYASIIDCWTGATVPLWGDRCVCCHCTIEGAPQCREHITAPCAAHPERLGRPVVPFAVCVIPERVRPVVTVPANQPQPLSDEEAKALLDEWLGRL